MSWLRKHVLGDPQAMASYRRAQQDLANYVPTVEPDETLWKLDMRVLELAKTVPYLRRRAGAVAG